MEDLINFISTVGFPIAACIYMARVLRAEMQAMTKAVDNMNNTIGDLNERLDRLEAKFYD